MEFLLWGMVFLAGTCVGSFLNVVICRVPQGKSIVYPPSHCPSCLHPLRPADLLPVVSYMSLKGKCRYCGCRISPQYPAVEVVTGILFFLAFIRYGCTLDFLRCAALFSMLIPAAAIDLKYKIIPDKLNLAGLVLGVPFLVESKEAFFSGAAGFLTGGGLLLLIAVASRGGMGGGDIKLAAVMGLYLGWKYLLLALFLAFAAGGAAGAVMILFKMKKMKDAVPFGPYLALGAVAAALAGDKIISWYAGFFVAQ